MKICFQLNSDTFFHVFLLFIIRKLYIIQLRLSSLSRFWRSFSNIFLILSCAQWDNKWGQSQRLRQNFIGRGGGMLRPLKVYHALHTGRRGPGGEASPEGREIENESIFQKSLFLPKISIFTTKTVETLNRFDKYFRILSNSNFQLFNFYDNL